MTVDAHHIISVSLRKIQGSRSRRGGPDLCKNLLVSNAFSLLPSPLEEQGGAVFKAGHQDPCVFVIIERSGPRFVDSLAHQFVFGAQRVFKDGSHGFGRLSAKNGERKS